MSSGAFFVLCSLAHGLACTEAENLALATTRHLSGLRKQMRNGMVEIWHRASLAGFGPLASHTEP
jgi:hypothetical protein